MNAGLGSLTVVVPNWETPDYTIRSVEAIVREEVPAERVVVVDNGSQDDSVERFQRELPESKLVKLEQNVGYARAANAGVDALPGSAYLIVNNDAFVQRSGSIRRMLGALADPRIGIVVPRLLNSDQTLQPSVKPLDTPAVAFVRATGLSRYLPNRWQPHWSTHWDHGSSREISAADGAVMLIRAEAWEQIGGFSPGSYMYAEDTGLCWRAAQLGWKVWFEADAAFVHLGNATASRRWSNPERSERWSRSEAHLVRERLSALPAMLSILFTAAGLAARVAAFRLLGQSARATNTRAELRGYLSALRRASG
ncbi:MAG TPA: glycosyltransferase family 2 protein [Gaiellaceae bacterium]|nr:glycosyltransferase family 2 protein [Gaiellaceae bacterium]